MAEEAIQKRDEGVECAEKILVSVATKQEVLFAVVVECHGNQLERLGTMISEVGVAVGGASLSGGYVNREKQLHSLQVSEW